MSGVGREIRKSSRIVGASHKILERLYLTEVTVARQMKKAAERADQPIPGEKPIRLLLDRGLRVKVPIPALWNPVTISTRLIR